MTRTTSAKPGRKAVSLRIVRLRTFIERLECRALEAGRIADLRGYGITKELWWRIQRAIDRRNSRASELAMIAIALVAGDRPDPHFALLRSADEVRSRFAAAAEAVR